MVWPLLRGRSPTRSVAPKRQGGSGVLTLRHFPRRVAAEESGAAKFRFIGFAGAMLLEAIGPAGRCSGGVVLIYRFWANLPVLSALRAREGESVVWPLLRGQLAHAIGRAKTAGAQFTSFVSLTRARGRERGLAVVTGSLAHAIGRAKTAGGLGRASLRLFLGAWLPKNWRGSGKQGDC